MMRFAKISSIPRGQADEPAMFSRLTIREIEFSYQLQSLREAAQKNGEFHPGAELMLMRHDGPQIFLRAKQGLIGYSVDWTCLD
jgi:hypothetical protein